jgi:prolipoprotein diacylglyceryltransferase
VPEVLPIESLFGEENAGQVLWATQIWMSANALLLGLLGLWLLRRRKVPGTVALWLVFLYSLARIAIEAFRGDSIRGVWLDGAASTSQLIGVVSAVVALVWLLRLRGRSRAPATA